MTGAAGASSGALTISKQGRHVLVVDDDPEIRETITWALEDEGLTVMGAGDGQAAVDKVLADRPALILLDMGLPILSGEEVAATLRERMAAPPPIIVVTAAGSAAERAARCGAVAYLAKPFQLDRLVELVTRHMERGAATVDVAASAPATKRT